MCLNASRGGPKRFVGEESDAPRRVLGSEAERLRLPRVGKRRCLLELKGAGVSVEHDPALTG